MKKVLITFFILLMILGVYLLIPNKVEKAPHPKLDKYLPSHPVKSLKSWQKINKANPETIQDVFKESNHEGSAAFIGPFRVEVAVYKNIVGIYIDNQKNSPTMPKKTKMKIQFSQNEDIDLKIYDNGLLIGLKNPNIKLPLSFTLTGAIGGKPFTYAGSLTNIRKTPIIKRGKRND